MFILYASRTMEELQTGRTEDIGIIEDSKCEINGMKNYHVNPVNPVKKISWT